jgi:hypothetical protein
LADNRYVGVAALPRLATVLVTLFAAWALWDNAAKWFASLSK